MPIPRKSPNKITSEGRSELQNLINDLIDSLGLNKYIENQKIKTQQMTL